MRSSERGLFLIRRSMPIACSAVQSSFSSGSPSFARVGVIPIRQKPRHLADCRFGLFFRGVAANLEAERDGDLGHLGQ